MNQVQFQVLPSDTQALLEEITRLNLDFLTSFYLSGGTALALQLGHRQSEDLDFFTSKQFDPHSLLNNLTKLAQAEQVSLDDNTLNLYLSDVKLQFLFYPYTLVKPLVRYHHLGISSVLDVALTKLITISQRGSKKDFVDFYFLLDLFQLKELFTLLPKKYGKAKFNQVHILKSLTFFREAETQPMPRMIRPVTWLEVKQKITKEVTKLKLV